MKLLLIEDERELAKSIQNYLNGNEFMCECVNQRLADFLTCKQTSKLLARHDSRTSLRSEGQFSGVL